jgi:hypothetical protein
MLSNLDVNAPVVVTIDSVQIYDSPGAAHVATVTYTNTAPGRWGYVITVPAEDGNPREPGAAPVVLANTGGTLTFDPLGKLVPATVERDHHPAGVVEWR